MTKPEKLRVLNAGATVDYHRKDGGDSKAVVVRFGGAGWTELRAANGRTMTAKEGTLPGQWSR